MGSHVLSQAPVAASYFLAALITSVLQVGLEKGSKGALAWDEAVVGALRIEYPKTFGKIFSTPGVLESAILRHVSLDSKKRKNHFDEIAEVKGLPLPAAGVMTWRTACLPALQCSGTALLRTAQLAVPKNLRSPCML